MDPDEPTSTPASRADEDPHAHLAADPFERLVTSLVNQQLSSAAAATIRGRLADRFDGMPDDAVVAELTGIRGVGDWTARMFLLFALGREDVFPVGDLAIRRAMTAVCGAEADDRDAMVERAEPWRPYRSYAALYLWHHHEDGDPNVPTGGD